MRLFSLILVLSLCCAAAVAGQMSEQQWMQPQREASPPTPTLSDVATELQSAAEYSAYLQQMQRSISSGQQPTDASAQGEPIPTIDDLNEEMGEVQRYTQYLLGLQQDLLSSSSTFAAQQGGGGADDDQGGQMDEPADEQPTPEEIQAEVTNVNKYIEILGRLRADVAAGKKSPTPNQPYPTLAEIDAELKNARDYLDQLGRIQMRTRIAQPIRAVPTRMTPGVVRRRPQFDSVPDFSDY